MFLQYTSLLLALAALQANAGILNKRAASDTARLPVTFNAISLDKTGWSVSTSSADKTVVPTNVLIDNDAKTTWTSPGGGTISITLDMKALTVVTGLTYLPAQAGHIGVHTVDLSVDGKAWVNVAKGTYLDDVSLKKTFWSPQPARFVRLTAIDAKAAVTVAEIGVMGVFDFLAKDNRWKITADSQNAKPASLATSAIDSNLDSFWHSDYAGTPAKVPGYPHFLQIDIGTTTAAIGLAYHPRQDGPNGRIGKYEVSSSNDGKAWAKVSSGLWSDDKSAKMAKFQKPISARFFKLTALSEAGNRGPWASAGELNLIVSAGQFFPVNPANTGNWGYTVDFPTIPVAAAVVSNKSGGSSVVTWSSFSPIQFTGSPGGITLTSTFDIPTHGVTQRQVTNTHHDMFCPGVSLDASGRPVVTGGNNAPKTSIYDPNQLTWGPGPDMKIGRGYHSSATTSEGKVFTIGGSFSGGNTNPKAGEILDIKANKWTLLSGCPAPPMMTKDRRGNYRSDNHAWLFGWKKGFVFHAGPSKNMNWYGTAGTGSHKAASTRADDGDAMNGNAVMFDAAAGKILTLGGGPNYDGQQATDHAYVVTIGEPNTPAKVEKVAATKKKRAFANSVVLPNGQVFTNGGQQVSNPFTDDNALLVPEIFDPNTKSFTEMSPMNIPRTYHSIALLLPDATVLCAGGGLCGAACSTNHFDGVVFNPPYLFNKDGSRASRPTIASVSGNTFKPGASVQVKTDRAVRTFSMVRAGSATHSVNTDQRRIPLSPKADSGTSYTLTIPNDAGIALPGNWMLFAIDGAGVPSVAKTFIVSL